MNLPDSWMRSALCAAYDEAALSPDDSSQVGAVLYDAFLNEISRGHNDFTQGVERTPERNERPAKYTYTEHAERNAIYAAVQRRGDVLPPAVMVGNWLMCTECARAVVQSGIKVVVRHQECSDRTPDRWEESIRLADEILEAGGVTILNYSGVLDATGNLHCGEIWNP